MVELVDGGGLGLDAVEGGAAVAVPSFLTQSAIAVAVVGTVLLGVFPQAILTLVNDSAIFIR